MEKASYILKPKTRRKLLDLQQIFRHMIEIIKNGIKKNTLIIYHNKIQTQNSDIVLPDQSPVVLHLFPFKHEKKPLVET